MPEFLLEFYVSRLDRSAIDWGERAWRAADELAREGTPVRFVRSILLPEEETCLLLYEAGSAVDVQAAAKRAALPFERVTEAISEQGGGRWGHASPPAPGPTSSR